MAMDPFRQLSVLNDTSKRGKVVKDCYRLLYHDTLWLTAYDEMTKVKNNQREEFLHVKKQFVLDIIQQTIIQFRKETFRFYSMNRSETSYLKHIIRNELTLRVILMVLRAIYEPIAAFHQNCNVLHRMFEKTILKMKNDWKDVTWCIEGKITHCANRVNDEQLLLALRKKIDDRRFLLLIHHLLKKRFLFTQSSIPHAKNVYVLIERLLLNVYADYVELTFENELNLLLHHDELVHVEKKNQVFATNVCKLSSPQQTTYYVRLQTSKQEAVRLKLQLEARLFKQNVTLQLSIVHGNKGFYVGPYLCKWQKRKQSSTVRDIKRREALQSTLRILVPQHALYEFVRRYKYGNLQTLRAYPRFSFVSKSEREIIRTYNAELLKLGQMYRLADNFRSLEKVFLLAERSFIRTLMLKRKKPYRRVIKKLRTIVQGKLSIKERTENGREQITFLYSFRDVRNRVKNK